MKLFTSILASFLLFCTLQVAANTPIVRFGLVADTQYADVAPRGNRYYNISLKKLQEAIDNFNDERVDFAINLGDMIDRNPADLDLVMNIHNNLKGKLYAIPGNHDYSGFVDNNMLFKKLKMPAEYYSFTRKKWRFIMLNTNEVASYANIEASNKEKELAAMKDSIESRGRNNFQTYNGGISKMQMLWLLDQLTQAEKKGENVIVCTHHPLYPETELTALNDKEILETLTAFTSVKLVLSGHHHVGGFGTYEGIPCVTAEGMLETEDNAYGIVEIYEDKILILGKGRMTSREIKF